MPQWPEEDLNDIVTAVSNRAVGRFQILDGHTLSRVQIMTMKLVGTSTKSLKYWVGKCPCAHPVPTALLCKTSLIQPKNLYVNSYGIPQDCVFTTSFA